MAAPQATTQAAPKVVKVAKVPEVEKPIAKVPEVEKPKASNIPEKYKEIIEIWYGPDQDWDRHSLLLKHLNKWYNTNVEFDKILTEKYSTEILELAKGNRETMRDDHYGCLAYVLLGD